MDVEDFIARYPSLWHLAYQDAWLSIERHGLLSTEQILRRWEVEGSRALALMSARRDEPVVLDHPMHGRAVLRDQAPLSVAQLAPALTDGMTVERWLRMLNGFVFFFPTEASLRSLQAAYANVPSVIVQVRTRSLVREHEARVRLAGINTGNTRRRPALRGSETFLPIRRYDHSKRRVQEVAVMDEVADLDQHILSVQVVNAV